MKTFKRFVARAADDAPPPKRLQRAEADDAQVSDAAFAHLEAALVRDIADYLRMLGWHVVVFSTYKRMPASVAGWPDIVAFMRDCVLLVECKVGRCALRPSQVAFRERISPHCGQHVRYIVARTIDDVMRAVESMMYPHE